MSIILGATLLAGALAGSPPHGAQRHGGPGGRAAEGDEVVMKRLFPKTKMVELEVGAGYLLNPTFVDTALARGSIRYHWSEAWGLGLAFGAAAVKDRDERRCIESFYNDPLREGDAVCHVQDDGASLEGAKSMNIGPAYTAVRELKGLVTVWGDYTLAYGKQILLHGAVSHFDLRVRFGAGLVFSTFHEARDTVRGDDGRPARGDPLGEGGAPKAGVNEGERDGEGLLYGEDGRPEARQETSPCLYLAIAEELQFFRRFFLAGELAGYVMTSEARGVEPFFVAHVGLGMRL